MDTTRWEQLARGSECPLDVPRPQSNEYWDVVGSSKVSTLYLTKTQTYRGHCLLIFDLRHATSPDQLLRRSARRIAARVEARFLRSRHSRVSLDALPEMAADGTPEEDAERHSDLKRLAALAGRLSEREQELIALKYGAALDNREIARLMRLSDSNVGTILHRTVQTLRCRRDHRPAIDPSS